MLELTYDISRKLGSGACSDVVLATRIEDGEQHALKLFHLQDQNSTKKLYN